MHSAFDFMASSDMQQRGRVSVVFFLASGYIGFHETGIKRT